MNYDLYSVPTGSGAGPASTYTIRLNSIPNGVTPGATSKGFVAPGVQIYFPAAGSGTVTFRRPWFNRYNGF